MPNERCQFVKEDGTPCGGYAVTNSSFCFTHAPELAEQRAAAVRKGGEARRGEPSLPLDPLPVETIEELTAFVEDAVNQVRTGRLSTRQANALAKLVDCKIRILNLDGRAWGNSAIIQQRRGQQ